MSPLLKRARDDDPLPIELIIAAATAAYIFLAFLTEF